jgi:hypothetical protein
MSTYLSLLDHHRGGIRIPMLQRDYAQGRPGEQGVRERFLDTLQQALEAPADDPSLPRNLDFIYGTMESGPRGTSFFPLDGQQRLTTLFLLHWYLAWRDECIADFQAVFVPDRQTRFSYSVRAWSSDFFDKLVLRFPEQRPEDVPNLADWITDQPWYYRVWRYDPTIVAVLTMLQALHERFRDTRGLYRRLVDADRPAITFELLDLKEFKLSDELYIKMNARGKQLTEFEHFKAQYEKKLQEQFQAQTRRIGTQDFTVAEFVARRLDTTWADFFWALRPDRSEVYDKAAMNLFRVLALVSRDTASPTFLDDAALLRSVNFVPPDRMFIERGWLDESFTRVLCGLLEAWSTTDGLKQPLLPDTRYFDERDTFLRLSKSPVAELSNPDVVMFTGYVLYLEQHGTRFDLASLQEWMRVVRNLAVNSDIDRTDRLQTAAIGLRELVAHSDDILPHMAALGREGRVTGFTAQQVQEEALKAELILSDARWRALIDQAEGHAYFRGQIGFLCDFSGVSARWRQGDPAWNTATHRDLQERFAEYLSKAEWMFGPKGLNADPARLWQRALLTVGDYLLERGVNWSFLVDAPNDRASWKRLLSGTEPADPGKRRLLQQLWDKLTPDRDAPAQLQEIINVATGLEPWIEACVRSPGPLNYCERSLARFEAPYIYLLATSQMNGRHAELYSYALHSDKLVRLYAEGMLEPLQLYQYESVKGSDLEPYIPLKVKYRDSALWLRVKFNNGQFRTTIDRSTVTPFPELETLLREAGFVDQGEMLGRDVPLGGMPGELIALAGRLGSLPTLSIP